MADELKPCPFCGCLGEDLVRDGIGVTHECCGFVEWNEWNTRPIEDALRAEVAALKAELAKYTTKLTCEQAASAYEAWDDGCHERDDRTFACVFEWDAAIRAAREGEG